LTHQTSYPSFKSKEIKSLIAENDEVFGLIVIVAFAKQTPVIVNNSGALAELLTQSGGGFIYNNADQLIEYMEKLRLDPNLRNVLGANGYQSYRKYYTEQYYIKRYYKLIQELDALRKIKDPAIDALQN
jgi:glycosyltransferase involved in cell wall biosynthesis